MKTLKESLVLILSFILVFGWVNSPLADYTIQILGLLVLLLLITSVRSKGFNPTNALGNNNLLSIFLLNSLIYLLIFSTGGIKSTLYFLVYFVGFGIAFVFEPVLVFVYMLLSVAIFAPDLMRDDILGNGLKIGSIILMSPLAFFFGREYRKEEAQEEALEKLAQETSKKTAAIAQDAEQVIENESDTLSEKDVEKLEKIIDESESIRSDHSQAEPNKE